MFNNRTLDGEGIVGETFFNPVFNYVSIHELCVKLKFLSHEYLLIADKLYPLALPVVSYLLVKGS